MVQWLGNLSHHQKTLLSLQKYPLWSSGQDFFTFPLVRGPYLYRLRYMIRIGGRRVILVFRVASLWLQLSHRFSLVLSGTNFPLFSSTFYHYLKVAILLAENVTSFTQASDCRIPPLFITGVGLSAADFSYIFHPTCRISFKYSSQNQQSMHWQTIGTNFPLFSSTFYHYLKVLFCCLKHYIFHPNDWD